MPVKSVDGRGRIYLPKDAREDFGERFRVVRLENGIKLIPVDEDPVEGLKEAMEGAEEIDIAGMGEEAEKLAEEEIEEEMRG